MDEITKKLIIGHLSRIRKENGITYGRIAKSTGIDKGTIRKLENWERKGTVEHYQKIALYNYEQESRKFPKK